jgi:hypothetical protein
MRADYLRPGVKGSPAESAFILVGYCDVWYNAGTIAVIDANLEDLSHQRIDHPDIDRLLDARRIVALWYSIFGGESGSSSVGDAGSTEE